MSDNYKQRVKRICAYCSQQSVDKNDNNSDMVLYRDSVKDVVLHDGKYYHKDCFVELCNIKLEKRKLKKWIEAKECINKYELAAKLATKDYFDKNDIYNLMVESYSLSVIPSTIWMKLNKIYDGEIQGMTVKIPPDHLYDMWKRKINFLEKIHDTNKTKGKSMDAAQRLNYDLTVLVNKYDSYLEWLNKQKILEAESKIIHENILQNVNLKTISKNINSKNNECKNNTDNNMDSLLDELFD